MSEACPAGSDGGDGRSEAAATGRSAEVRRTCGREGNYKSKQR